MNATVTPIRTDVLAPEPYRVAVFADLMCWDKPLFVDQAGYQSPYVGDLADDGAITGKPRFHIRDEKPDWRDRLIWLRQWVRRPWAMPVLRSRHRFEITGTQLKLDTGVVIFSAPFGQIRTGVRGGDTIDVELNVALTTGVLRDLLGHIATSQALDDD